MEKVLLTRPIFDSKQTENSLKKLNIKTLSCPLIEIKKISQQPVSLSDYDIILFTSKNGARNFEINLKNISIDKLIFAVGNETKNSLLDRGFKKVISADGNLEILKKSIIKYLRNGFKILHPTSSKKNKNLEKFFFQYKCKYFHLQCYSTLKVNKKKNLFKRFMIAEQGKIITIYSRLTAESFIEEVKKFDLTRFCKDKSFIVISENVKKELGRLGKYNIDVAKKPNEDEMISLVVNKFRG